MHDGYGSCAAGKGTRRRTQPLLVFDCPLEHGRPSGASPATHPCDMSMNIITLRMTPLTFPELRATGYTACISGGCFFVITRLALVLSYQLWQARYCDSLQLVTSPPTSIDTQIPQCVSHHRVRVNHGGVTLLEPMATWHPAVQPFFRGTPVEERSPCHIPPTELDSSTSHSSHRV
jgi:hypothetical protein